jgi:antitoxin ParD1/3/4
MGKQQHNSPLIENLLQHIQIASVTDEVIHKALKSPIKDFEDAVTSAAAMAAGLEIIVTRNKADFVQSSIPAMLPEEFMYISLPDTMRDYIEKQVAQGGYSSVSEYFRELVRQDQKLRAKELLQTMLLKGLNSGNATEMTAQDWEDIRQAVREKTNKRQSAI